MSESPSIPPCPPNGDKAIVPPPVVLPGARPEAAVESRWVNELPAPPKIVAPPPLPTPHETVKAASHGEPGWWASDLRIASSSWLLSFLVHFVGLFVLGAITLSAKPIATSLHLLSAMGDSDAAPAVFDQPPSAVEPSLGKGDSATSAPLGVEPLNVPGEQIENALRADATSKIGNSRPTAPGNQASGTGQSQPVQMAGTGGGWEGRNPTARAALAGGGSGSGSKQSELAVERGLRWLAAHQRTDGSWSFDLRSPPCNGLCRNSGSEPSTTAATALALLPFLGAGYTPRDGEHKEIVKRGLYYLGTRAVITPRGIDLRDGTTMYAQGIAALALCEAYGMTGDPALKDIAQGAIRYIVEAQDLRGGGWRYNPGEPGDTTVTGWQLMALKSGQMAKIAIPSPTINLAQKFLDSVQFQKGARYGYQSPMPRAKAQETTTAVGLLCRMYTGWRRDRPALYQGVGFLNRWGPSKTDMYYNYYATQVLHHWEGPEWQTWNRRMRDYLVATQAMTSHEAGSWYFPDRYGDHGGRLYNTAMVLMTLEVYYRYMPLYGQKAVRGGL